MINDAEGYAVEALALNYDNAGFKLVPNEQSLLAPINAFIETAKLTKGSDEFRSLGLAISTLSREVVDLDQVSAHTNILNEFLPPILKVMRLNNDVARNVVMPIAKRIAEEVDIDTNVLWHSPLETINVYYPAAVKLSVVSELLEKYSDLDKDIPENPIKYRPLNSAELIEFICLGIPEYDEAVREATKQWNTTVSSVLIDAYTAIYLDRTSAASRKLIATIQASAGNDIEVAFCFLVLAIAHNAKIVDGAGVSLEDYRSYSALMLQSAVSCFNKASKEYLARKVCGYVINSVEFTPGRTIVKVNAEVTNDILVSERFYEGYFASNELAAELTVAIVKEKEKFYTDIGERLVEERRLVAAKRRDSEILSRLYSKIIAVYDELPADLLIVDNKEAYVDKLADVMKATVVGERPSVGELAIELICKTYLPHMEVLDIIREIRGAYECCMESPVGVTTSETKKPSLTELATQANMRVFARWIVQFIGRVQK